MNKRTVLISAFLLMCFCIILLCSCGKNEGNAINEENVTADNADADTEMIEAFQNEDLEQLLGSEWELIYHCTDDRLIDNGIPSTIRFYFWEGEYKYQLQSIVSEGSFGFFKGGFTLEDGKLYLPIDPEHGEDEIIVMDIVDGNRLEYNAELSSEGTENEIVSFGPQDDPIDLNGLVFEIDITETAAINQ